MSAAPLLENTQIEFPPALRGRAEEAAEPAARGRRLSYQLRSIAGQICRQERVAGCGRKLVGSRATLVKRGDGGAHYGGVETCGSVWLCAVCAGKIAEGRRKEVEWVCDRHAEAGGAVYMATFTVPHNAFQSARELRDGVADAWRRYQASRAWRRVKKRHGIVGTIRALEITHGRKGWHPHLHVLIFADALLPEEEEELSFWLFDHWAALIARRGLGACSPDAFDFHRCARTKDAGAYVAKWGCDSEVAKASTKTARGANKSPWGLLLAANAGEPRARELFEEYAMSMKGGRHLTWSKGLRELYGLPERTDEELAAAEEPHNGAVVLGTFEAPQWRKIVARGLVTDCLEAAESGGWQAVLALLRRNGIHVVDTDEWGELRE